MLNETYQAFVEKIVEEGLDGPYAVARSKDLKDAITFSLDSSVWQEEEWPDVGVCVVLSKLEKRRRGWRAKQGRLYQPSDESNDNQTNQPRSSEK